jgi:hypothetical protein
MASRVITPASAVPQSMTPMKAAPTRRQACQHFPINPEPGFTVLLLKWCPRFILTHQQGYLLIGKTRVFWLQHPDIYLVTPDNRRVFDGTTL